MIPTLHGFMLSKRGQNDDYVDNMIMEYFKGIAWLNNGWVEQDDNWNTRHWKDAYSINYVHSGPFEFRFDGGPIRRLEGPSVWLHYPGPVYSYGTTRKDVPWNNRYLNFTGRRMKAYIRQGLFPITDQAPLFAITQPESFRSLFDDLRSYVNRPDRDDDTATHMLEGLLLQLHKQDLSPTPADIVVRRIWELHDAVRRNVGTPWNFKTEAEKLSLSYSHFRRVFREVIGNSPRQTLIQFRMEQGSYLLLNSNRTIAEVAFSVGYPDHRYFMKAFRKYYGKSPGKYRKELTETTPAR